MSANRIAILRRVSSARNVRAAVRRAFTIVELLVVIAIVGLLVAILLPAVQAARESSRIVHCQNNLKQLGLATQLYDEQYGYLPASACGPKGYTPGSGFVSLLPFVEEGALADLWNIQEGYSSTNNLAVLNRDIPLFVCPSMAVPSGRDACGDQTGKPSSYALSTGSNYYRQNENNGAFVDWLNIFSSLAGGRGGLKMHRITLHNIATADGTSKTFCIGEMSYTFQDLNGALCITPPGNLGGMTQWGIGYPYFSTGSMAGTFNSRTVSGGSDSRTLETFRGDHRGIVNFVFCDGSVRGVSGIADGVLLDRLANRKDGEVVGNEL